MSKSEQYRKAQQPLQGLLMELIALRLYDECQMLARMGMTLQAHERKAQAEEMASEEFTKNNLGDGI